MTNPYDAPYYKNMKIISKNKNELSKIALKFYVYKYFSCYFTENEN